MMSTISHVLNHVSFPDKGQGNKNNVLIVYPPNDYSGDTVYDVYPSQTATHTWQNGLLAHHLVYKHTA